MHAPDVTSSVTSGLIFKHSFSIESPLSARPIGGTLGVPTTERCISSTWITFCSRALKLRKEHGLPPVDMYSALLNESFFFKADLYRFRPKIVKHVYVMHYKKYLSNSGNLPFSIPFVLNNDDSMNKTSLQRWNFWIEIFLRLESKRFPWHFCSLFRSLLAESDRKSELQNCSILSCGITHKSTYFGISSTIRAVLGSSEVSARFLDWFRQKAS